MLRKYDYVDQRTIRLNTKIALTNLIIAKKKLAIKVETYKSNHLYINFYAMPEYIEYLGRKAIYAKCAAQSKALKCYLANKCRELAEERRKEHKNENERT